MEQETVLNEETKNPTRLPTSSTEHKKHQSVNPNPNPLRWSRLGHQLGLRNSGNWELGTEVRTGVASHMGTLVRTGEASHSEISVRDLGC